MMPIVRWGKLLENTPTGVFSGYALGLFHSTDVEESYLFTRHP